MQGEGLGQATAIAGEIATHLEGAIPEAFTAGAPAAGGSHGALFAFGGHIIMGRTLVPPQVAANLKE